MKTELEEIYSRLKTLGIPVAYIKFTKPQKPPFAVYYESGTDIRGADGLNLYRDTSVTVELYTRSKSPALERGIEAAFADIPLDKSADIFIPAEELMKIEYTFNTVEKI